MVAGRPELWISTTQEVLTDGSTSHRIDVAAGFRPLQLHNTSPVSWYNVHRTDQAARWTTNLGQRHGLAVGVAHPAAHHVAIDNPLVTSFGDGHFATQLAVYGNDIVPTGAPQPFAMTAGDRCFDAVDMVILPSSGPWAPHRRALERLMGGIGVVGVELGG
jgi:hypothetical protein